MPRKNTSASGKRAEVFATKELESQGYTVTRAHLSRGAADIIAWKKDDMVVRYVQVKFQSPQDKTNKNRWGQPANVNMIKREFEEANLPPTGQGELWVWRSNRGWIKQEILIDPSQISGHIWKYIKENNNEKDNKVSEVQGEDDTSLDAR